MDIIAFAIQGDPIGHLNQGSNYTPTESIYLAVNYLPWEWIDAGQDVTY